MNMVGGEDEKNMDEVITYISILEDSDGLKYRINYSLFDDSLIQNKEDALDVIYLLLWLIGNLEDIKNVLLERVKELKKKYNLESIVEGD